VLQNVLVAAAVGGHTHYLLRVCRFRDALMRRAVRATVDWRQPLPACERLQELDSLGAGPI